MTAQRGEVIRGVAAAAVLAGVVGGVPVVLAAAVGWPLPRALPTLAELGEILSAERAPEAATVWKILASLAWVAWAQVVASVIVETAASVREGLAGTLPGLGLAQGLTAPLVAAVVLAWPGGGARPAAATSAAAVASSPSPPPPSAQADPATGAGAPAAVDHVVVRRDTLWDLAERYLGDGRRAGELFERNRGRPQPDGSTLSDPGLLQPGWVLSIPVEADAMAATGVVEVRPGDTLWGLAEDHLGDGHRYSELVELNAGRPQPDGGVLVDPDRIEPGWVLRLPAAEPGAQPAAPSDAPVAAPTNGTALPPTVDAQRPAVDAPAVPPGADEAEPAALAEFEEDDAGAPLAPVGLIGGGVATAGVVVLLDRRRRAQQRRRPRGHRPPQPGSAAADAERALRAGADHHGAARIDLALRAAAGNAGLPALRWVEATPDAVTLVVDGDGVAPPGFVGDGPGRWRSGVDDDELAALGAPAASPAPCLVPVGRDDAGVEVLIDLEGAGVVTVVGDTGAAIALLRAMTVAVATAPWSEGARVLVVGLDDLRLPGVEVATLGAALAAVERRLERTDALAGGHPGSGDAACRRPERTSEPLVVLSTAAASGDQRRALSALTAARRSGVAVVMAVPAPSAAFGLVLSVAVDGSVTVDDRRLRARQLDEGDVAPLDELLETAASPAVLPADDHPTPPAPLPERHASFSRGVLDELLGEVDVLVRVFGPVEAVRLTPEGETKLPVGKQKSLEAITYLALRETPVDREELQAALWPAGTNSAKTFQNVVWAARKALGVDRDGAELLPDPVDGRYGSNPRLVTDYGLFHELVTRAATEDPNEGERLMGEALGLVRGEPFVGVGRNYVWVAPHAGMVVAQVVDAAEELAERRLAAGDFRGAEEAARQGLGVFPCEERLYRALMRCAHASGSRAGVQRAFDELVARAADPDGGVEPEDTVHEDTIALLDELTSTAATARRETI